MTYNHVHTANLDVGLVIQRTFNVVGKNALALFVVALVLGVIPGALFQAASVLITSNRETHFLDKLGVDRWAVVGVTYVIYLLGVGLMRIAAVRAVIEDANGRKTTIGECFSTMLRFAIPGMAVEALYTLGIFVSFAALIVPGFIFLTAFQVVIPALVAERVGVFGAFQRSAQLTKGRRVAIFGALFLMGLIVGVIGAVLGGIAVVAGTMTHLPLAGAAAQGVVTGFLQIITTVMTSVLYVRLVNLREGGQANKLAEVFA